MVDVHSETLLYEHMNPMNSEKEISKEISRSGPISCVQRAT